MPPKQTKDELDQSIQHVQGTEYKCSVCQKIFGTRWGARRHVKSVHSAAGLKQCPWPGCMEMFRSHNQLRSHAIQEHDRLNLDCPNKTCRHTTQDINGYYFHFFFIFHK